MPTMLDAAKAQLQTAQDAYYTAAISLGTAKGAVEAAVLALTAFVPSDARVQVATGLDHGGRTSINASLQPLLDRGGVCYVPAGSYLVDPRSPLLLRDGLFLILHANAVLQVMATDLVRSYAILGKDISDAGLFGGHIVGDRLTHIYKVGSTSEWNHGVGLTRCSRVAVRDLLVEQCAGDGLSINGEDLEVVNVVSTGNRRQGMTIGGAKRVKVLGGSYSNTRAFGSNPGTAPMAGIDIEPDSSDVDDVLIDGVNFADNGTSDILVWSRTEAKATISNIVVQNCSTSGTPNGLECKGLGGPVSIRAVRNTMARHKGASFKVGTGSTITIGTSDLADANTMLSIAARATKIAPGIASQWDIQAGTGAMVTVGVNKYGGG
jgi:hypothetical protein